MIPMIEPVAELMAEVAAEIIMPRFQKLAAHEVSEKGPGDLVTIVDTEAEHRIAARLLDLVPGSRVVGEEGASADPSVLAALAGDDPVWLIDPLDGTQNFANGKACFATIIAYCVKGEIIAGWIGDPIAKTIAWAVRGEGAWSRGAALRVSRTPIAKMTGSVGSKTRRHIEGVRTSGRGDTPAKLLRYACVGREYLELAKGSFHFAQYAGRLKPWDHAAGVLIHAEAGGYGRLVEGATPYSPARGIFEGPLRLAPDEASWRTLHSILPSY